MPSIIPGFEYDIFISYRQKDNKGDRWVSEFVEELKTELESTFKEEISVYFDINPHDGLLETHDVDESLKDKLNCLVFIPIVSRTYCDPQSFAWEHEFKKFVDLASNDQFGLRVKLPFGNVASRVLPVRIHDLDEQDIELCESVLGGVMRGVDFIFKSPGVNRPLRLIEDNPKDNTNKTFYRDQINKVANAINDIILSLHTRGKVIGELQKHERKRVEKSHAGKRIFKKMAGRNIFMKSLILLIILLSLAVPAIIFTGDGFTKKQKAIAFIPLRTTVDDNDLINSGDNFIEAIVSKLKIVRELAIIPRISTLQYRNTDKPIGAIRKELKANYIIDGRIWREEDKTNIWVELSASNKMLWSNNFVWEKEQISSITSEIVRIISDILDINLSVDEISQIDSEATLNPDANLNFLKANVSSSDAWFYFNYRNKIEDSISFKSALQSYARAIEFDTLFAQAYARRSIALSWGYFSGQLDTTFITKCKEDIDKAMAIDSDLKDAQIALGFYYYFCKDDLTNALIHFENAAQKDPYDYQPLFYMALAYRRMGNWDKSKQLISRVIRYNPSEALFLTNIGLSYQYLHNYDSALIYHQKAIDIMPAWPPAYINKIQTLLLKNRKTKEAWEVVNTALVKTGDTLREDKIVLLIYDKQYKEALKEIERSVPDDFTSTAHKFLYQATIYNCLENREKAKQNYDSARVYLERDLINAPENFFLRSAIGVAYAGLGESIKAIEEGEKAIRLAGENSMDVNDMRLRMAQIYTMIGDYGPAISNIEYLLLHPSMISVRILQVDPVWKPLISNPEFKEILNRHSKN